MTAAGGESRANYLLKWEAIRSSREQGATSYDLWGLATGGIAHFKTGFGGREVRYIGAWDLVLDPLGRQVYETRPAAVRVARCGAAGAAARRDGGERRGATGRAGLSTSADGPAATERARRLGRRAPSTRRAATSTSRGPGPSTARASGWRPRFLVADDGGRRARADPAVAAASAAAARTSRAARSPTGRRRRSAGRAPGGRRRTCWRPRAIDVVAADAEVPAADDAFRGAIEAAGFHPIEEIQPSRHRISLPLDRRRRGRPSSRAISKSTRQRIRRAESAGVVVVRHDAPRRPGGVGEGFVAPDRAAADRARPLLRPAARDRRAAALLVRAARRRSSRWWTRGPSTPGTSSTSRRATTPPAATARRA